MIKIITNKKAKKRVEPLYLLTFNYMIGDGNGNTSETLEISIENPYLERFCTLLRSLSPLKNHWGIVLEMGILDDFEEEGQITKDDRDFLEGLMFETDSDYFNYETDDYACEFIEGVRGNSEYTFLVFEGLELDYFDDYGVVHKTEIV